MDLDSRILQPHILASWISGGSWKSYAWIEKVSHIITHMFLNGGGKLIVSAPPQHGKSSFISLWTPIWFLNLITACKDKGFPCNYPKDARVILTSYNSDYIRDWAMLAKSIIVQNENKLYVKMLNEIGTQRQIFKNRMNIYYAGVGGGTTGKPAHLAIIDDPVKNYEEAKSPIKQETNINWYETVFSTRFQENTIAILLMTRWHENDLAGYLLAKEDKEWKNLKFKALADSDDILGRQPGDALCPERFSSDYLKKRRKSMGTWLFNAMYQQEPAPIEGGIIKKRWLRFYTELPRVYYKLQSWDTGFKEGITDSYSVCTTWAMCKEGFFLIDVFRERMEYPKLKSAVREQYWKHTTEDDKVNVVVIEDKASGQSLIQDLKKSNRNIPIRKENKLKDKEVAAIEISGSFESGNVFIRQDAHWMDTYISELVTFPNSQYNDQMDSTSQALKWLRFKWEQFIEIKQKKNIKKRPTGRRI